MHKLLLCFVLVMSTFASIPVKMDQIINKFVSGYGQGIYRAGLTDPTSDKWWQGSQVTFPSDVQDPENTITSYSKWAMSTDYEFAVTYPYSLAFKAFLIKMLNAKSMTYDSLNKALIIQLQNNLPGTGQTTEDAIIKTARKNCRTLLACFRGKIEDNGVNTMRKSDTLYAFEVTFRRLFRHGILPPDLSYITVVFDGSGSPKEVQIKWPTFRRLNTYIESAIDINTAIDCALHDYSEVDSTKINDEYIHCTASTIKGMATAWIHAVIDNKEIITPCYAFQARFFLSNNDSCGLTVEIPRLQKYVSGMAKKIQEQKETIESTSTSVYTLNNVCRYSLSKSCFVSLNVYDLSGRLIAPLINKQLDVGIYTAILPKLSKGVYVQVFKAVGRYTKIDKITVQK
jgi:hypothetical protein